jgi:hypothetical protein
MGGGGGQRGLQNCRFYSNLELILQSTIRPMFLQSTIYIQNLAKIYNFGSKVKYSLQNYKVLAREIQFKGIFQPSIKSTEGCDFMESVHEGHLTILWLGWFWWSGFLTCEELWMSCPHKFRSFYLGSLGYFQTSEGMWPLPLVWFSETSEIMDVMSIWSKL